MDLTPRTSSDNAPLAPRTKAKKKWRYVAMLVVVVFAGGFIVSQFLTSAIDFYCNVDEVGVRVGCEEDRRLRVQGNVVEGSISESANKTTFSLVFNNKTIDVIYDGDPGGIFQECIPVVAHGRLQGDTFEANRIEVRHSNEYEAANADRISESEVAPCSQQVG
ncbi:MAG: cytochrome c maturation protein CcmE [Ilumatobacteraceae bacterium]